MPVTFHILDVAARDEKIVSANETEQLVQYDTASLDSEDEEFQAGRKKAWTGRSDPTGKTIVVHLFGKTATGTPVRVDVKG